MTKKKKQFKGDPLVLLHRENIDSLTDEEAKALLHYLRGQFQERYRYLVGEWRNSRRAKSTRDGTFVTRKEVIAYLNNTDS